MDSAQNPQPKGVAGTKPATNPTPQITPEVEPSSESLSTTYVTQEVQDSQISNPETSPSTINTQSVVEPSQTDTTPTGNYAEPLPPTYVAKEVEELQVTNPQGPSHPAVTTQSEVEPSQSSMPSKKTRFKKIIIGALILLFFLLLGGTAYGAYAVAYEKIKLANYPDVQKKISTYVISLPFMPKTPKYLLTRSAYVHQNITKESFDISMAIDSQDLVSQLGLSGLDVQAKGSIDYSDTENVKLNVNASITKDFNIELLKKDKFLYFKINKVPQLILAALGLKSNELDPLLGKWVSYDTSPLDTEARQSLQDKEVNPLSEQYIDQEFQKYLDEKVLSKMTIKNVNEDGFDDYEITLSADPELIDYLGKKLDEENQKNSGASLNVLGTSAVKLSDTVKSLIWKIYIDRNDYYMRKLIITSDLEVDSVNDSSLYLGNSSSVPKTSKAKIGFAAKFGDFGKEFNISAPTDSITSEEFLNLASEIMQKAYGSALDSSSSTMSSSRDARRQADLQTLRSGLEIYRADYQNYPASLTNLSPTYLSEIPVDPAGTNYYYRPSKDLNSYDLCANLESIIVSGSSCPDPNYNYHVKNP
jgi:hypothetical protein